MFRAKAYTPHTSNDPTRAHALTTEAVSRDGTADALLGRLIGAGVAIGGQIEERVEGIGWCVADEPAPSSDVLP